MQSMFFKGHKPSLSLHASWLCIFSLFCLLFSSHLFASVTSPVAGSQLTNQATATYIDFQGVQTLIQSNIVRTIIQPVQAGELTSNQTILRSPGSTFFLFHHFVNTGNLRTNYTLNVTNLSNDDYDAGNLTLVRDTNGNGMADAGEPTIQNNQAIALDIGESIDLVISGTIPANVSSNLESRIQINVNSQVVGFSTSNVDIVKISDNAAIQLTQIATIQSPKIDDIETFILTVTNTGNTSAPPRTITVDGHSAQFVTIEDDIPAGTILSTLTGSGGTALYHLRGTPADEYITILPSTLNSIDKIAYGFTQITAGQTARVNLSVKILPEANNEIINFGIVRYLSNGADTSTTSNTIRLALRALPSRIVYYTNANYDTVATVSRIGLPLFVEADLNGCNTSSVNIERVTIVITSALTGDKDSFIADETGPNTGKFRIISRLMTTSSDVNPVISGDGVLETKIDDSLTASVTGCDSAVVQASLLIDPAGVVFDSRTNLPIAGATVKLIDVTGNGNGGKPGQAATVFDADGITHKPSTVVTGVDGRFEFPLVPSSVYRLDITPPGRYVFPSALPPNTLPAGRTIHLNGSYGGNFPVNTVTGPVVLDVPLDPYLGGLIVEMTPSRPTAEVADFVDYAVVVKNSGGNAVNDVILTGELPTGFVYQRNSTQVNGNRTADPDIQSSSRIRFSIGNLADGGSTTLTYRVRIAINALQGDGNSRASAASGPPLRKQSNTANALVKIYPGVFDSRGYILGHVFLDCNKNGLRDKDELGIPGVRIYIEDGRSVVTDILGKYSFYDITPQTHVLKIDDSSLPSGSKMIPLSNRNAGDGRTRFVDMKNGELQQADFAESSCQPNIVEQIEKRREILETIQKAVEGQSIIQVKPTVPSPTEVDAKKKELDLSKFDNSLNFIELENNAVLPKPQTNIKIKGGLGSTLKLLVNEKTIDTQRVGKKSTLAEKQLEVWEYIGINLRPGENTLEAIEIDPFGNTRKHQIIKLIAPGDLVKLVIQPSQENFPADGKTLAYIRISPQDKFGNPVTSRIPITLESSLGIWQVDDANPKENGIQTFIENGKADFKLMPPAEPGTATIKVISGKTQSQYTINFLPELRSMIAAGVIEGAIHVRNFDSRSLQPARTNDGFEQELEHFSTSYNDGKTNLGARAAMFLKGKIKGDYLLTLAYDSDKDTKDKLFQDIQPNEFYPVYGDSADRGFETQSTSRMYVRLDKNKSWLLYGDFVTPTATPSRNLGAYSRSLTGLREHYETNNIAVDAFASRDSTRQVIAEIPANGTSGPFMLNTGSIISNSEKVEIITRSRNQTAVIMESVPQARFSDYDLDILSGRLLFRGPIPSLDSNLNPISIRVTYEVESGGSAFWTTGASGDVKLNDKITVGGSFVSDRNPQDPMELKSLNTTIKLGEKTEIIAEVAQTDKLSSGKGNGSRFEVNHQDEKLNVKVYSGRTDFEFDNPSAGLSKGRSEAGGKLNYRVNEKNTIKAEALKSEDVVSGSKTTGAKIGVEQVLNNNMRLETSLKHAQQTGNAIPYIGTVDNDVLSISTKLSVQLEKFPQATVYGEVEQDVKNSERRILALGGEYQMGNGSRLYGRHEFVSSLGSTYALNETQRRNATVFGVDTEYMKDGRAFSEYRATSAFDGRSTEAAIGLRNLWTVTDNLRFNTSFERVQVLSGGNQDETAAITGAVEYKPSPRLKSTARLELRSNASLNGLLSTLGAAYRVSDTWSFLGKNTLSIAQAKAGSTGNKTDEWLQLGLAYRSLQSLGWNMLSKYEYKWEEDDSLIDTERFVHILSIHANTQFNKNTWFSTRYATKFVTENSLGLSSKASAHLLSGRVTRDLTEKWDVGLMASLLTNGNLRNYQSGFGGEGGYQLKKNMWVSLGYNIFGFTDRDFSADDYTQQGPYVRFRAKFDEYSFGKEKDPPM